MAISPSAGRRGFAWDMGNSNLRVVIDGTTVATFDDSSNDLVLPTNGLTVTAGGITVTAGGVTVTAGGLTVTAGGLVVTAGRIIENLTTLTNVTTAGNETYTAAQLAGGVITRDPAGAARTDTTDTAANIIAGTPALSSNGDTLVCYLINTADAAEVITLAGGTGVTMANAGQTLAQNESVVLLFRRTSGTAVTCYIVGA